MTLATLAPGQLIAARYELARPLGASRDAGVTRAWLAVDRAQGHEVVLKFDDARDDAHAGREHGVRHPALLASIGRLEHDGHPATVYPWLGGGEIGRLRGRAWPLLLRRVMPVVDALGALHAAGWVHGDVKSANVLLDDDGFARLADFGSVRRIGATTPAPASPYATSPERLAGAPAAVADDVYACGALLYELVSGHPPFYPDVTPQRVREELPAPLTGRPEPPPALRDLVAQCLAKQPADRPASVRHVREMLEQCLAHEEPVATPPPATFTPRPPVDAAPIRAQWRRDAAAGPTPQQLRREGFRRGLLAGAAVLLVAALGFTFFLLPDLVASSRTPAGAPAAAQPASRPSISPPAEAAPDLAELAELKRRAEAARAPLPPRLQQLERRDAVAWGPQPLATARAELAAGDAAMASRDYATALQRFATLATTLDALERQLPRVIAERLAQARTAFDAGRSADARAGFESVLRVDPQNGAAKTGVTRSAVLDAVLRETAQGALAEQAGDAATANAAYQRALALDPATTAAREGLARLRARAAGDAYSSAVAAAQLAFARRDYAAAQAAYERAAKLRPGAAEVAEGLEQIRRATETRALAGTLEQALAAEREERWTDALRLHREALKQAPALAAAREGVERSEPRAMLDAELQAYLDKPDRLYSVAGRDIARNVLERSGRVATPGPRLQSQRLRLQTMLTQAETPIRVALASDNATDVQIYRVGKLGLFDRKDLELMPGRYTVVGTRAGYRDVRKELNLVPGASPPTVEVRCEERI